MHFLIMTILYPLVVHLCTTSSYGEYRMASMCTIMEAIFHIVYPNGRKINPFKLT